jgi:ubiquinone/menaquinone biosynthesis C-methylase UbiE
MTTNPIEAHYYREDLYSQIIIGLTQLGVDLNQVTRTDLAPVDEFHVRGAEVSRELANNANLHNTKLLDVGCGIGGPCRMLADEFNCQTTGIDLSEVYVNTATQLSKLVGFESKTQFVQGDATQLPFPDGSFEVVWTQHVQMNIENKKKFYSEIDRVLKEGGAFIYYDIFKKGAQEVSYPMPWATDSSMSFLEPPETMESILTSLSLQAVTATDQTIHGVQFFEKLLEKISQSGPPKLGLNLLMGATTKDKIVHLLQALQTEKLILQSGIFRK